MVPYLRGYGSTQFLDAATPRSAKQAGLGYDLLTLMDALQIKQAILAGFDWGTIPVNVVAALWPQRCDSMVAVGSYLIQDRRTAWIPTDPDSEAARDTAEGVYAGNLGTELAAVEFQRGSRLINKLLVAPDDPAYADFADAIDEQPVISVPSVTLDPEFSTTFPATNGSATAKYFTGTRVHHVVQGVGENILQHSLAAFVDAILQVDDLSKARSPARAI